MELQNAWPALEQGGVALFAISYDSVETLAGFAKKRGITYPLLADEGSHTIRALGLLNEHLAEQHAVYGIQMRDEHQGVAYPGTFVLDERGVIVDKHFEQSYRVRPTAQLVEEYAVGQLADIPARAVHASSGGLEIQAWTDAPTYRPYQQIRLHVRLALPPGLHVYGAPAPDGYVPLQVQIEPREALTVGDAQMPVPRPFHVAGLDEEFLVYEGSLRMLVPLQFTSNLGPISLGLDLAFQMCDDKTCFPPASIKLEVMVTGLDLIRD